jgi:ribosomal protein S13
MNVKELKSALESANDEREVVIPVTRLETIGPTPAIAVASAHNGFDWDHGKFIIYPESKLREIDTDEIRSLQERLNAAKSPLTDLMRENWQLRHEIKLLKQRLGEE